MCKCNFNLALLKKRYKGKLAKISLHLIAMKKHKYLYWYFIFVFVIIPENYYLKQ